MMQPYNSVLDDPRFQEPFKPYIIQVVAPASGTHQDKMAQLYSLKQLPLLFNLATFNGDISYHSNSDDMRFDKLKEALFDSSDNTIIWALRGGYGCARLIDKLNHLPKPTRKKLFIGFSDITALHLFFSQKWQWPCIHGAGLAQLLDSDLDPKNFLKIADILSQKSSEAIIDDLSPLNQAALNATAIKGTLTGGNLTLVGNSIGTSWEIQTKDKILFLEEINVKGYAIDRSLFHLHQAGIIKGVSAIVLGEFLNKENEQDIHIALGRFANELPIPVFKTNQFGHGEKNYPLIYNALSEIKINPDSNQYALFMKYF
ncbi:MAG: LD-carboxypeptidase [Legionella sp.]|nr:LD-carboxypeptidase [Legionella sp.]